MIDFYAVDPRVRAGDVGDIPLWLWPDDPRPAREQLHERYAHGGGWRPFTGFTLTANDALEYPGDPPQHPLARGKLRDEEIVIYRHSWVAIIQPDRSFEVCRMD